MLQNYTKMKIATIYQILNKINNNSYVGSTTNFNRRKNQHLERLRKNKHHSVILQRAYRKYGECNFVIKKIETFPYFSKEDILNKEQYYIDRNKCKYNVCRIAGSQLGSIRDEKFRIECSKRMKGKEAWNKGIKTGSQSDETKEKRANKLKGRKTSEETKLKISLATKGKSLSNEHKIKLSESKLKGTSNNKPLICIDEFGNTIEYLGVGDAQRKTGVAPQTIYDSINNKVKKWKRKSSRNLHWSWKI